MNGHLSEVLKLNFVCWHHTRRVGSNCFGQLPKKIKEPQRKMNDLQKMKNELGNTLDT